MIGVLNSKLLLSSLACNYVKARPITVNGLPLASQYLFDFLVVRLVKTGGSLTTKSQ